MKKLLFLILVSSYCLSQAQTTRNDSYAAMGIITSFKEIPFGFTWLFIEGR